MRVLALIGSVGCAVALSLGAGGVLAEEQPVPTEMPATVSTPAPTATPAPPVICAPLPPTAYGYPPPGYDYDPRPPAAKRTWYGWQTLATDGGALLMLYAGAVSGSGDGDALLYGSLAVYNLGAPIVHMAHGNFGRGVASLAVRSLPSMMVFGEPRYPDFSLAMLTLVSIPTIIAVDAAALAREDEEERPVRGYAVKVAPTATANKSGALLGVAGIF